MWNAERDGRRNVTNATPMSSLSAVRTHSITTACVVDCKHWHCTQSAGCPICCHLTAKELKCDSHVRYVFCCSHATCFLLLVFTSRPECVGCFYIWLFRFYWNLFKVYHFLSSLAGQFCIFEFYLCCLNNFYVLHIRSLCFKCTGFCFSRVNYVGMCVCCIFGPLCFRISVFTWRRKQFASETYCIVLSIFVTVEKVLTNAADITQQTKCANWVLNRY